MKTLECFTEHLIDVLPISIEKIFGSKIKEIKFEKCETYNWSYIFIYNIVCDEEYGVYVKIPKSLEDGANIETAINNKLNKQAAIREYETLSKFQQVLPGGFPVKVVEPLAYISEFNAIVTKRAHGQRFYRLIREGKIGFHIANQLLRYLGQTLSLYHSHRIEQPRETKAVDETFFYPWRDRPLKKIIDTIICENKNIEIDVPISNMLLGFEMRNIIYDGENLYVYDITEIKKKPIYEDIAQFIVSVDLINWGRINFTKQPVEYFRSFLDGYFNEKKQLNNDILRLYIIKEYLRFYSLASNTQETKTLLKWMKAGTRKFYIEKNIKNRIKNIKELY